MTYQIRRRNPLEAIAEGAARGAVQELGTIADTADETAKAYEDRNRLAVAFVALVGGFYGHHQIGVYDDEETGDDWRVIYANLPTGQVSWHVPVDTVPDWVPERDPSRWDGHSREEKNDRLDQFAAEIGNR